MSPMTAQQRCRRRQAGTGTTPAADAPDGPQLAERELFTVKELAVRSGIDAGTLYRLIADREIAAVRLTLGAGPKRKTRGAIRVARLDWEAFLARHRTPAKDEQPAPAA